jgi:hypothetical protein
VGKSKQRRRQSGGRGAAGQQAPFLNRLLLSLIPALLLIFGDEAILTGTSAPRVVTMPIAVVYTLAVLALGGFATYRYGSPNEREQTARYGRAVRGLFDRGRDRR